MSDSTSVWTEGNVLFVHASKRCYVIQSLILHYPNFQRILRESLRLVIGEEVEKHVEIGFGKTAVGLAVRKCTLVSIFVTDFLFYM